MKLKSLLYGTAAVLVSTGATNVALAADLPVAAEPVEYVRVCDAFGKGFFYIPGSDTCLKIDGYVRIEARINETEDDDDDAYETRARGRVRFDARTETDLGLLRSMISYYVTLGPGGNSPSNYDLTYDEPITLDDAFITLSNDMGQLTVGHTASFFDFFGGYTHTGAGGHDQTTDQTLFAYTFNIGNGVSASISLEDPYSSGRKLTEAFGSRIDTDTPSHAGTYYGGNDHFAVGTIYGGQEIGDIVANLRVDQGWGSAQIMGALRQLRQKDGTSFTYTSITSVSYTTSGTRASITSAEGTNTSITEVDHGDEWGWAVGAGLEVNIPGAPVSLALQGGYSEGAGAYVAAAPQGMVDAVYNADTNSLELTKVWQINAGISIAASSTVTVNIDGAYGDVDEGGQDFDYDYWGIAGNVVWQPVSGLAISAELQYMETNGSSSSGFGNEIDDEDSLNGVIRVQRSF